MHPLNMKVIDICEEMKVKQAKQTGHQAIYVNPSFVYNTCILDTLPMDFTTPLFTKDNIIHKLHSELD